jgi:IS1 family transposase
VLELDELWHFKQRRKPVKTKESIYVMTMVSRNPRQLVSYCVSDDKDPLKIEDMVLGSPPAKTYCTDGYNGYLEVYYPGKHIYNTQNKNDTYTVESVNADLRHYIPLLRRRSRCFPRTPETLDAVITIFKDAYNKFGQWKARYLLHKKSKRPELPYGIIDFI